MCPIKWLTVNDVILCGMWTKKKCCIWKKIIRVFNQQLEIYFWIVSSDYRKEEYILGYEYRYNRRQNVEI